MNIISNDTYDKLIENYDFEVHKTFTEDPQFPITVVEIYIISRIKILVQAIEETDLICLPVKKVST